MAPSSMLPDLVVGHMTAVASPLAVLAHQGGWDEMLMVIVPVSAFAAMLYAANRRATSLADRSADDGGGGSDLDPDGTTGDATGDSTSGDAFLPRGRGARNERRGPI